MTEIAECLDNTANAATLAPGISIEQLRGQVIDADYIEACYQFRDTLREVEAGLSRFLGVFASDEQRQRHADRQGDRE
jgi:chloramphenicol 3-O-phosphotransferase